MSALDELGITKKKIEDFWKRVDKGDGCWNWTGHIHSNGYGGISVSGKQYTTHRFSFIINNKFIPSSKMDIMHLCDNKRCVNPKHLKLGTRKENILDFISKGGKYGKSGEKNRLSKITDAEYSDLRKRYLDGERVTDLAKEKGMARQSLSERFDREGIKNVRNT